MALCLRKNKCHPKRNILRQIPCNMPVNVKLRKEIWAFKTSLGYRVVDYL